MRSQQALIALRLLRKPQGRITSKAPRINVIRGYATPNDKHPIDETIENQLDKALDDVNTVTSEIPINTSDEAARKARKDEILARAQIVFGSKLVGPQRQAQLDAQSKLVAGVLVPPRPEEPDNCCMSGCVNCVWDMYRDEMEDWVAKSTEARAKLQEQKAARPIPAIPDSMSTSDIAMSMDDDGGGSESNWSDEESLNGDMFEGIPIGIRAFMENEKRLKAKHRAESTANG